MHPFLFSIGSYRVPTFGVIGILTFAACYLVVRRYARIDGLDPRVAADAITLIAIVGLLGARALEAIVSWRRIAADPAYLWTLLNSAGVYFGGVIAAVPFGIWWFGHKGIPVPKGLDLLGLVGALSMALARWGCFAAGCCWGKPTSLPWGVTFPPIALRMHPGMPPVPLHPTQIYLALNSAAIFGILLLLYRRKRFDGQIGMIYLVLKGVTRFLIEFVRGDDERGFVFGGLMSTSQLICLFLIAGGVLGYFWLARAGGRPPRRSVAPPDAASA